MDKEKKDVSFEKNLEQLETIVKNLESGDILLDDAIEKFNEAVKIAKICDDKLKNAEEKVNKILNKNDELEEFNIEN